MEAKELFEATILREVCFAETKANVHDFFVLIQSKLSLNYSNVRGCASQELPQ